MGLYRANSEAKAKEAVKAFWKGRSAARSKQVASGKADQGERSAVTGGKNMDGFISLVADLVKGNGLKSAEIHLQRKALTLPGYPMQTADAGAILHRRRLPSLAAHRQQGRQVFLRRRYHQPQQLRCNLRWPHRGRGRAVMPNATVILGS